MASGLWLMACFSPLPRYIAPMRIARTVVEARAAAAALPELALVPTMGALHAGHVSLMRRGREVGRHVAVSIFVNPMQFGPSEDFMRYPRPLERDLELCREAGVDLVFAPGVDEIYPPQELDVVVDVPALTSMLEGTHRPGHFIGVCRVVAKLLSIVQPRFALFGKKDYQQLKVIEAMAAGLALPVKIVPCATLRDADGLALSSRNAYLTAQQRPRALALHKALLAAQQVIATGALAPALVEQAMQQELRAHHLEIDYAVVRDARTLGPLDLINPQLEPVVCLVAARLDGVRLIDSAEVGA